MALGRGGGKGEKVAMGGDLGEMGGGAGPEGTPLSLPHVSFDVIQAEGHTLVCAAPFGVLLALSSSAQLVLNDLRHDEVARRYGGSLEPSPFRGPALEPRPHLPHRRSQRAPAP